MGRTLNYKGFKCDCRFPDEFTFLACYELYEDYYVEYVNCCFCNKIYELLIDYIDMSIPFVRRSNIIEVQKEAYERR